MIAILQYNSGNTASVYNCIQKLGFEAVITDNPEILMKAEKVIFPGVGEASSAMRYLKARELDKVITSLRQPVLGICLGQQLLCNYSAEGNTDCLGIFDVEVHRFPPLDLVPHMGWNSLKIVKENPLITPELNLQDVYFVHSFYCGISDQYTTATCDYILPFSAAMKHANFYTTQFHPEKSAGIGQQILHNFLNL